MTLDREDIEAIASRVAEMVRVPSVTRIWISEEEARALIGGRGPKGKASRSKMQQLRCDGLITSNSTGRKGENILYNIKSIQRYLDEKGKAKSKIKVQ